MKLYSLDIPAEPAELPLWLDTQLVGTHLRHLVEELSAVAGNAADAAPQVEAVLGTSRSRVLRFGLKALPEEKLRLLLRHPHLLLELQQIILEEGEAYWDRVLPSKEMREVIDRAERDLSRQVAEPEPEAQTLSWQPRLAWYRRPWLVGMAAAAAVLMAVFSYQHFFPTLGPESGAIAWGWAKPGALPQDLPAPQYLQELAQAAQEWFKKRPDTPEDVAKRLGEFRQGCTVLLLADHRPLPAKERDWLKERCRVWAEKLDQHLVALEKGTAPVEVRAEIDQTVNRLIDALQSKAKELQAA